MAWIRADGRPITSDPQLQQQFTLDRTACRGEMMKATGFGAADVGKGCMADRGYLEVQDTGQAGAVPLVVGR